MGNPFKEESSDLLSLDTKDIAKPSVHELLSKHYERGTERFCAFMKGLQSQEQELFYKSITRNTINFFTKERAATDSKQEALKADCNLFSQLFISCQSRQCDLNEFFKYENQEVPASLSDNGKLHTCSKSGLTDVLQAKVVLPETEPQAEAIVLDGSALINSLPPRTSTTFDEYASVTVIPYVQALSAKYKRTDIVFDVYLSSSLKSETRLKRGTGARRRVTGTNKTPRNWKNFMREAENKTELFHFLADKIADMDTVNSVVVTKEELALSKHVLSLDDISPCSHEEADTRMFVHARHAVKEGKKVLMIKANDTDVVVIAISTLPSLQELGLQKFWLAFGQGVYLRWIPIHELVDTIGPEKTNGMLFFHAFSGCDIVSAFRGKAKLSAWQTWNVCNEVSDVFSQLSKYPPTLDDDALETLERFVVTMYDRSSTATRVNDARLELFARKQRSFDSIPPTQAALLEHAKRAAYQAGVIWSQATVSQPETQSPGNWGWIQEADVWKIFWSTLPPVATICQELTKCGCTTQCRGRCKCYKYGLSCTPRCSCSCLDL